MKTTIRTRREHAFVVRLPDLQKLWELLEDRIGTAEASAECSDDIERKFDAWKQLASYDNPPAKEIIKLSISSRSKNWSKSTKVDFSDDQWSNSSIRILVEAPEQVCLEVKDKIFDILDGTKPWYSFLARVDFLSPLSLLSLFLCILLTYLAVKTHVSLDRLSKTSITNIELGIIGGIIIVYAAKGLDKLKSWLFPVSCFAFGQGEQRYKTREKVQGIIIAFVVSLTASMVKFIW